MSWSGLRSLSSNRLSSLASLVPRSRCLIDIGSDHGYLGLILLRSGSVDEVWNVELSSDSLSRSRQIYRGLGLLPRARFILSDGFKSLGPVPEGSTAVIAGMGSPKILGILRHLPPGIFRLILLSHTPYLPIRAWASSNGWRVSVELYFTDGGITYLSLSLERGERRDPPREELIFGSETFIRNNINLFREYWAPKLDRIIRRPEKYRSELDRDIISLYGRY